MPVQQIAVSPFMKGITMKKESKEKVNFVKRKDGAKETLHSSSPTILTPERCESQVSTLSTSMDICRICHCEGEPDFPLITPCLCAGSLHYVHQACLQKWIKSADAKTCELCKFSFIMTAKVKPFQQWEKLQMSSVEKRKITCSVTFHIIAITCVVWSLYVLIDRTMEEMRRGVLEWPFWTKIIVVAIGFTGGLVFMYVQCKMYVHLVHRWRAYNRVIYIENAPERSVTLTMKIKSQNDPTSNTGYADAETF